MACRAGLPAHRADAPGRLHRVVPRWDLADNPADVRACRDGHSSTDGCPDCHPAADAGLASESAGARSGNSGAALRDEHRSGRLEPAASARWERIDVLLDGSIVMPAGEQQQADGRLWRHVKDGLGREGWVAAEFLTAEASAVSTPSVVAGSSPSAVSEAVEAPTASPTWPVPLIPTATLRPANAVPTRTPRLRESPSPVAIPTSPPVMVPAAPATMPAAQATNPAATGNCHASYPDFCLPPSPPDLNCNSSILAGRRRFTVRPPDPHRFDNDKNGVGCE